jgi:hypothetical protein
MPQTDGAGHLSIRAQAAIYGISKSEMGRDRRAGCPADEDGGWSWRAAHRRPYLRLAKMLSSEEKPVEPTGGDSGSGEEGKCEEVNSGGKREKLGEPELMFTEKTGPSLPDDAPIGNNGNGNSTTAQSLGRLRALEQSLAKAAEAALAKGDVAEGLSISRQHAIVVARLVSTETAWSKLQERRRELLPGEWLTRFAYCYRLPVERAIHDYLLKRDDPELRRLANHLEQIVKNFCNGLKMYVNGG